MWDIPDWIQAIVKRTAQSVAREWSGYGWDADDLEHECLVLLVEDRHLWEGRSGDSKRDLSHVGKTVRGRMVNMIQRGPSCRDRKASTATISVPATTAGQPAQLLGGAQAPARTWDSPSYYEEAELIELLPGIWDYAIAVDGPYMETYRDPTMPRGHSVDPSHGNTTAAKCADLQRAFKLAGLTDQQKRAIFCVDGLGETQTQAAARMGIAQKNVSVNRKAGIDKMLEFLNR